MSKRRASQPDQENECELLRLRLTVAEMREEIQTLRTVNAEMQEALKENSRVFSKMKPQRP